MFTGLVEDVGTVARADRRSDALVLAIRPTAMPLGELVIGESICHDGTCLTVTEVGRDVGSSRVDLQACKLEYSIVSPK